MEAHASPGGFLDQSRPAGVRVGGATLVKAGAIGGLAGGVVTAMWQMVVGAIAQEATAAPGIDSSFWTAVTSIPSVLFGMQWGASLSAGWSRRADHWTKEERWRFRPSRSAASRGHGS